MKTIAVILSGCGNKDGTEITEAVSLIIALSQAGARVRFFAPNLEMTPQNFLTDMALSETRNILVESARISRSQIEDLEELEAKEFDGLALPGGMGAALYLCNWSKLRAQCQVLPSVQKAVEAFYTQSKPIAAICIAPVILAKVLGSKGISLTMGTDKEMALEIQKTGAHHESCPVTDFITDREHKIITTPAYMMEAKAHEVFQGISGLVKEFIEMA